MLNGPRTPPNTFTTWSTTACCAAGRWACPGTGASRGLMGSFRELVVGRPPGRRPGRMAQTVDIAYPALHNPAAKGASLMTRRVVVLLVWLCMLAAAPVAAQEP